MLADFETLLNDLVRDQDGVISVESRGRAIEAARLRYSHDAVRELVDDVTWPQPGMTAPVPAGWSDGAWIKSAVRLTSSGVPDTACGGLELAVGRTPTGWELLSPEPLSAGVVVRLTYTAEHELSAVADTIPALHRLPVVQYAAHLLCHQLATHYSGQRDAVMGADASKHETRAREYASRSKELRTAYFVGIGLLDPYGTGSKGSADGSGAAGGVVGGVHASGVASWPARQRLVRFRP